MTNAKTTIKIRTRCNMPVNLVWEKRKLLLRDCANCRMARQHQNMRIFSVTSTLDRVGVASSDTE